MSERMRQLEDRAGASKKMPEFARPSVAQLRRASSWRQKSVVGLPLHSMRPGMLQDERRRAARLFDIPRDGACRKGINPRSEARYGGCPLRAEALRERCESHELADAGADSKVHLAFKGSDDAQRHRLQSRDFESLQNHYVYGQKQGFQDSYNYFWVILLRLQPIPRALSISRSSIPRARICDGHTCGSDPGGRGR